MLKLINADSQRNATLRRNATCAKAANSFAHSSSRKPQSAWAVRGDEIDASDGSSDDSQDSRAKFAASPHALTSAASDAKSADSAQTQADFGEYFANFDERSPDARLALNLVLNKELFVVSCLA